MEDRDYGYVKIKVAEMIERQEISKNKLAHRAELQRTQLNQYCNSFMESLNTTGSNRCP